MKTFQKSLLITAAIVGIMSCDSDDDNQTTTPPVDTSVNFQFKATNLRKFPYTFFPSTSSLIYQSNKETGKVLLAYKSLLNLN